MLELFLRESYQDSLRSYDDIPLSVAVKQVRGIYPWTLHPYRAQPSSDKLSQNIAYLLQASVLSLRNNELRQLVGSGDASTLLPPVKMVSVQARPVMTFKTRRPQSVISGAYRNAIPREVLFDKACLHAKRPSGPPDRS